MKCKVCGAYNEDYLEYCENCAAPLTPDEPEPAPAEDSYVASTGETPPAWGFVRAPQWPKPEFDANTVSEEDIPETYSSRFNPRPAQSQSQAAAQQPAPPVPGERGYSNNVRVHAPVREQAQPTPSAADTPRQAAPVSDFDEAPVRPYTPQRSAAATRVAKQAPERKSATHARQAPVEAAASAGGYDALDDFEYDVKPSRRKKQNRAAAGSRNLLFIAAVAVLVVLIAVFAIIYLNKNFDGSVGAFFDYAFGGNPFPKAATITAAQTKNGDPAYIVTVYCKNNYTARFTSGETVSEDVVGAQARNCVAWRIPEDIFVPDAPIAESELRIKPNVVVISPNGEETAVEFEDEIVISIPAIELNVTSPTVSDFTTDTAVVPITGTVSDNTAAVYVNETQVPIDESGNFNTSYTLPESGVYAVTIEARKNRYQTASQTFNITFGAGTSGDPEGTGATTPGTVEGNVTFAVNDSVVRYATTSTMTVSGTMETGAVISVSGVELEGDVTQDAAAGTFSFTVKTESVGLYAAVITATKDNAAKSSTLYLEHRPDKDSYMGAVHVLDYDRIKNYPEHEQGYKVVGKVVEVYQSSPFVTARIQTSSGDIVFNYYSGVSEIAVGDGKTYNLYADPAGTYTLADGSTLPLMHAWYILKDG